jgi:kynurenine formamidase
VADPSLARLLTRARVYDLGRPLEERTPTIPHHAPFRMAMLRRHGDVTREDGGSGANELIVLGGHTGTHVDAVCHMSVGGLLHGRLDAAEACRGGRFTAHGVERLPPFLCRGVLLDVPAALGVRALEPGHAIGPDELEQASDAAGVPVREGDAVLLRTGWPVGRYEDREAYLGWASGVPGPDAAAARWLVERRVALTGSDTLAYEWLAPGAGHARLPVHGILLVEHGTPIVEVLDLEELARDGVREFAFVAVPLPIVGATGSPLRPLALVV